MIKLEKFSKSYGDFKAVKNINLEVKAACIYGFVGKNGAGKSTSIRCMMDLLKPTSGTINIKGLDSSKDSRKIKSFTSYMPSEITYYDKLSVGDFMKFNLQFSEKSMDDVEELADYFELDLNKKLGDLSLGNKKKVSIIIMLIKKSDLLIMDEPTSGLDPLMQQKFFDLMKKEKENGKTIFLSSHNLTEIGRYCDMVAIIKDGEIVEVVDMEKKKINLEKDSKKSLHIKYTTKDNQNIEKDFSGDVNNLIRELSELELLSLEIKPHSIEDEFIKYYQD